MTNWLKSWRRRGWLAAGAIALGVTVFGTCAAAAPPGDTRHGEEVYSLCLACHALAENRTGPRHCGLFGRRAGSVPGFAYSEAMKRSGIVWSAATLDGFLAAPSQVVPGTAMYVDVRDAKERADLIAYLEQAGRSEVCKAAQSG